MGIITKNSKIITKGGKIIWKLPPALKLTFDDIANADLMIGGDSADVADWNTFFDLPTNGTPFTSVTVNGDEVSLFGGAGINLKGYLFTYNLYASSLLSIIDTLGCIISVGECCFDTDNGYGGRSLTTALLPALVTAEDWGFNGCWNLFSTDFSSLLNVGRWCFYMCTSLSNLSLPVCTALGPSVLSNGVFLGITGQTITLTIPSALMTCNGGAPDGDIVYLTSNNTVTIITV